MNDQFWQSLPRVVDISHEDWSRYFDFWDELPRAELKPEPYWTLGMVVRLTGVVAYFMGIGWLIFWAAWLIWHFV